MMSQQNVDIAKRAIGAFNVRDVEAFVAITTSDFEWSPSMSPIEGETFAGRDGVRKYLDALGDAWERFCVVPDGSRERADAVLVLGRLEAWGRSSGVSVDAPLGMAFDLRGPMISRIRGFLDHDEALQAVGLKS